MVEKFLASLTNWKTTILGLLLAIVIYEGGVGNKLPETKQEWWAFALGVLAAFLGAAAKDATTGSRPLVWLATLGLLGLTLTGCATGISKIIDSAACDNAVIGFTGFYAKLGVTPSPSSSGFPLPSLEIGHGTVWRIGNHDDVEVTTGSEVGSSTSAASGAVSKGQGSLTVKASGSEGLKSRCATRPSP